MKSVVDQLRSVCIQPHVGEKGPNVPGILTIDRCDTTTHQSDWIVHNVADPRVLYECGTRPNVVVLKNYV